MYGNIGLILYSCVVGPISPTSILFDIAQSRLKIRPCSYCVRFAYRILATRSRRVDIASGCDHTRLLSPARPERYAYRTPCTHCVFFADALCQFLLLVCQLVMVSLLPHNVMIFTHAIRSLKIIGVERNRSVCRRVQPARRWRTGRVHSRVHTAASSRPVGLPLASTANTSRCGLSVPRTVRASVKLAV